MSSRAPSTSSFPTTKRSACDRCREQKLRCPARANGQESCTRCIRAGLECVTGYTKPLGRSGRDITKASSNTDTRFVAASGAEVGLWGPVAGDHTLSQLWDTPPTTAIDSTSMAADSMSSSSWLIPEGNENGGAMTQNFSTQTNPRSQSSLSDSLLFSNALSHGNSMNEIEGSLLEDSGLLTPLHSTHSEIAAVGSIGYSTSTMRETPQHQPSVCDEEIISEAECDLRLSQLNLELCRQLQNCIKRSQPGDTTELNSSENPFESTRQSCDGQASPNAFGDTLSSTSEFLAIIQCCCRVATGSLSARPNHHRTANSKFDWSSLGCVCILNVLSSYLRIIAIFDSLFLRLYELLCCSTIPSPGPFAGAGLQTLPGLQLAGFSVQQGNFQTKVLIQAVQHQFEMIEKLLGLPAEFRVSDRRESYPTGLLSDGSWRSVLQAVMNGQHGGEEAKALPFDRDRAVGSLGSLRGNILRIRQYLDV